MQRGYVSPAFLPQAGPCLGCLVRQFRRLSPAPALYDALLEHGEQGRPFAQAVFPDEGSVVLSQLVLWKWRLLGPAVPSPALYRLHVLEAGALEVSSHRVFVDPDCPDCQGHGR
jgi:bacteriocin biosynthesis cyclodehydratase domain-containing protein